MLRRRLIIIGIIAAVVLAPRALRFWRIAGVKPHRGDSTSTNAVLVTAYCDCALCCSWRRPWLGLGEPVISSGVGKGKPKRVGITTTGTRTHKGTIAADPKVFPFGTRLDVPGYGVGVVEDTGGAITGRHIDVWFPSHDAARAWGARRLDVKVRPH